MQIMEIINGKELSKEILKDTKNEILSKGIHPVLKIYLIGDNLESKKYTDIKSKRGSEVGVDVRVVKYPEEVDIEKLSNEIINDGIDSTVDGIIIQLPVKNKEIHELFKLIPVSKDVDGLNPMSLGLLWQDDQYVLVPATVKAIVKSLEEFSKKSVVTLKEFLKGKRVLIINRSIIIGKPLAAVLLKNDSTVTIAHSKSNDIQSLILESDIIISATGKAGFLNNFQLKNNVVIVDAGFAIKEGKVYGDYIQEENSNKTISFLSPVPNGVGPLGVAALLENTVIASIRKNI